MDLFILHTIQEPKKLRTYGILPFQIN